MRIAIILNGGVNTGHKLEGVPALTAFLKCITKENEVVIFSIQPALATDTPYKLVESKGSKFRKYFNLICNLQRHHRQEPFNIIHAFYGFPAGIIASFLGKMLRLPTVLTLMGGESANVPVSSFGMLRKRRLKVLIFWAIKNVTKVVVLSKYQLEILRENGLKRQDIEVIPFGVSDGLLSPPKKTRCIQPYKLVTVANINPIKDHFTLLLMFKELLQYFPAKLTIVGGDFYSGQIHEFVKKLELEHHVEFTGQKTNQEAIEYIKNSDLHVISSQSESLSVVFIEAMALGIPTCSTNVGLMAELTGSHCLTSAVGNPKELAKNARTLLTDEELRKALIQNGLNWVRHNSLENITVKYLRLYNEL
ncbi:hypothetical protein AWW67_13845 [Roseivirga seohaensis]|uniref:Glycosyl transferase family 1 domain-containing protein n=1 Tax=Roseivirga seohaensis TaxID=1914963 RepID=A0A150XL27_9BACT|nr:glycosyltransferase family 4 protein [Roseivirga seohaensis]KYG79447.1 hypothetical protein AWW67_13845 [Roseivirga seohaensis]